MKRIFSNRIISVASSVLVSVMAVSLVGYAATTISTNINTAGTLTVSGASTLSGNISADGTSATTTISGGLRADTTDNTLVVDFSSSRVGIATTSPSALLSVHGNTILGSADASSVIFRAGTVGFASTASTSITSSNGFTWNTSDLVYDRGGVKFGIGTTSPSSMFAVQGGNVQVTGTTTTSGLVATSSALLALNGGTVGIGTTTPRTVLSVSSTGTTTLIIDSSAAAATNSTGGCIEMKAIGGSVVHLAATTTPVNGSVAVWMLGACDKQ